MGINYASVVTTTDQMTRSFGRSDEVKNSAGGYVFKASEKENFLRFLILGSEGGSYYATEKELTLQSATVSLNYIKAHGKDAVETIVSVSTSKPPRAPKNDACVFALALAVKHGCPETKALALAALPQVCRIPTHLYKFLDACKKLQVGWGRSFKRAVSRWFTTPDPKSLAFHALKYQQREGWSMRDALRLSHPVPENDLRAGIFKWITTKERAQLSGRVGTLIKVASTLLDGSVDPTLAPALIKGFHLSHEMVNTTLQKDLEVQKALLSEMPLGALIRSLAKFTTSGLLTRESLETMFVVEKLQNLDLIRDARLHPMNILVAWLTYRAGKGSKGHLSWNPIPAIVQALEQAFSLSFKTVEPTGKRHLLALDVSGSMGLGTMMGVAGLTPRLASAALAQVYAKTEKDVRAVAFENVLNDMTTVLCGEGASLDKTVEWMENRSFGATDCSLPMLFALERRFPVDVFHVFTDSETWSGKVKPVDALRLYREKMGINSKLVVHGMVSNGFSIADPTDKGMMDVVGFDTNVPQIVSEFCKW